MLWILVTWDEDMPSVKHFEDEHYAIEMLKEAKPMFTAYLYEADRHGNIKRVVGW